MKKTLLSLISILTLVIVTGCSLTSVMGPGFQRQDGNTYLIRIGTGGGIIDQAIAAEKSALSRLDEEAKKFMAKNSNFRSYQIIKTERSIFPFTYYEYIVEFK